MTQAEILLQQIRELDAHVSRLLIQAKSLMDKLPQRQP